MARSSLRRGSVELQCFGFNVGRGVRQGVGRAVQCVAAVCSRGLAIGGSCAGVWLKCVCTTSAHWIALRVWQWLRLPQDGFASLDSTTRRH